MALLSAPDVIRLLDLKPHPEGGHFRETFRDPVADASGRAASTAVYFLLAKGERSHWHWIDAVEVWHYYAGAPLVLEIADAKRAVAAHEARARYSDGRAAAGDCAGQSLAGGREPGRLDSCWLHGRTGVPVCEVRDRPEGLEARLVARMAKARLRAP